MAIIDLSLDTDKFISYVLFYKFLSYIFLLANK